MWRKDRPKAFGTHSEHAAKRMEPGFKARPEPQGQPHPGSISRAKNGERRTGKGQRGLPEPAGQASGRRNRPYCSHLHIQALGSWRANPRSALAWCHTHPAGPGLATPTGGPSLPVTVTQASRITCPPGTGRDGKRSPPGRPSCPPGQRQGLKVEWTEHTASGPECPRGSHQPS